MKKLVIAMLLIAIICCFFACSSPEKEIVGTWKNQSTALGETVYTFYEDGTGLMSKLLGISVPFTYSINGDTLVVVFNTLGVDIRTEYGLTIADNKLILQDEDETLTYIKDN